MSEIELSAKVTSICTANYKNNCSDCLLRPACCSKIGPGFDGLNKWTISVNNLAESLAAE